MASLQLCLLLLAVFTLAECRHRRRHYDSYEDSHERSSYEDRSYRGYYDYRPRVIHVHKHYDHREDRDDHEDDHHVWRFQISQDFGPYGYLNKDGYLEGFAVDLLKAVCKEAHKTCGWVADTDEHCWKTDAEHEYPGIGLLAHWFDGCIGYLQTPDRHNSLNFTEPFSPNVKTALYFRPGDASDHNDVTGRKIGFVQGWATSQRCLHRQADITGHDDFEPHMYDTFGEAVQALKDSEVDAIVGTEELENYHEGVEHADHWFECSSNGLSVMSQYKNEVIEWWNEAFHHLQENGEYEELCEEAQTKHADHGKVHCIDDDHH